jgi:hypothetical protein
LKQKRIVAINANSILEIWKNKGQLQRAARLYELASSFQAASECYDADGDFEKAVEVLQRGDKFDDLIIYLSRYVPIKFLN